MKKEMWVISTRLDEIKKKFESMSKKSLKLGILPPTIEFTSDFKSIDYTNEHGYSHSSSFNKVIIDGDTPKLKDWEFIAMIEHEKVGPNYVNIVKAAAFSSHEIEDCLLETISHYSSCPPNCNHCNTIRERSTTFLCRSIESGEIRQIGSTCVDDFLGEKSLQQITNMFSYPKLIEHDYEKGDGIGQLQSHKSVKLLLALTYQITKLKGFVASKNESESRPSTRTILQCELASRNKDPLLTKIMSDFLNEAPNDALSTADEIIKALMNADSSNSYFLNAKNIIRREVIDSLDSFSMGIICSLPNWHFREAERALFAKNQLNEHFGVLKQRGELKLRLVSIHENYKSKFPCVYYRFADDEGRAFSWKASLNNNANIEIGKSYLTTATLSGHTEYLNQKITSVQRCSFVEVTHEHNPPQFMSPIITKKTMGSDIAPSI